MSTLSEKRLAFQAAYSAFTLHLHVNFPGAETWDWFRALDAVNRQSGGRRNDDTSRDAALAGDAALKSKYDEYIRLLHAFYLARDGEGGVLGART